MILDEALHQHDPRLRAQDPCLQARVVRHDCLRMWKLIDSSHSRLDRHARPSHPGEADSDDTRELKLRVEGPSAVAALHRSHGRSETHPPRSRWRELADAAKVMLSDSIDEPPSLIDLAARLDCSPFHLSRVFRTTTGLTLRGYIRRLRAALAADRLRRGEDDLTSLALDLGFCDHSHFTNSFRREWGVTPSRVRPAAGRRARQTQRSR